VSTDVSEEHIACIFRVEETSSARNQQASRCHWPQFSRGSPKIFMAFEWMWLEVSSVIIEAEKVSIWQQCGKDFFNNFRL
jgi:hypothetical protein